MPAGRLGSIVSRAGRATLGAAKAVSGWPPGRWPAPTVTTLLIVAVLLVGAVELLPKTLSDVTLSVRAQTEVLEVELDPKRTYVWWLPAGSYTLLTGETGPGCERRQRFDIACTSAEPTALTIEHGARVRFEVVPPDGSGALRFSAALTPRKDVGANATSAASPVVASVAASPAAGAAAAPAAGATMFSVHDASDRRLAVTPDLVTFESGPVDLWRIPLILKRVQVGESLTDAIATTDTIGAVRQPIMTDGEVRIFARGLGTRDRYQIQEERFDPADVVQIPADSGDSGLLLGVLTLDRDADRRAFDVTMHSALAEVYVRRLGAGHRIGVSMWSIVSQLPTWAALWIVWVSLIVVANYHAARLQQLQGEPQ